MTRSLQEVADTAYDDLRSVQDGFSNAQLIYTFILKHAPVESTVHALAQLGLIEVSEWFERVERWANAIETELDSVKRETLQ